MPGMRDLALVALLAAIVPPAPLAAQEIHPDELKPKIDAAIAEGVEHLFETQLRDGSWGVHGDQVGGQTAFCGCATRATDLRIDSPFDPVRCSRLTRP